MYLNMIIVQRHFRALLLVSCLFFGSHLASANSEFRVVASIKPVHSILEGLMEGIESPELLVSGNSTPFNYRPDGQKMEGLSTAEMVVWVGPELEAFLVEP